MSLSIPGRVVVFDYGEVISLSQSEQDRVALVHMAGVEAESFWRVYWHHRDELDHGRITIPEYWARVADELGVTWSTAHVQRLWAIDFRSWISVEPGTVDLLEELHTGGTRIALLSNAGYDFGDPFRRMPIAGLFEQIFVSAELGLLKPDPAIYREVVEQLGITPEQLVFIDNKQVNVDGAVSIGAIGHTFTSVAELRGFLTGLAADAA